MLTFALFFSPALLLTGDTTSSQVDTFERSSVEIDLKTPESPPSSCRKRSMIFLSSVTIQVRYLSSKSTDRRQKVNVGYFLPF
jgi:hypothetical protein